MFAFIKNFLSSNSPELIRPEFIYLKQNPKQITKYSVVENKILGTYPISDFITHSRDSKKEVASQNPTNAIDRLFGTDKYQQYAKSVKGFFNEEKVWKTLSKKYQICFSHSLDHQGVDVLISSNGKHFFGFQIKSSEFYAEQFRLSGKFRNVHGIIVVGKKFDETSILSQAHSVVKKYSV